MTSGLEGKRREHSAAYLTVTGINSEIIRDVISVRFPVGDVEAVGDVADDPVGVGRVLPAEAALQLERT